MQRPSGAASKPGKTPDTLRSIHQIALFFDAVYDTVHTTIREVKAAFESGFYLVWERIQRTIDGPSQIDETG